MKRIAFKMKLIPGFQSEYKKRHDEIWPELKALLKKAGVSDYSIFLDRDTNSLIAILKIKNAEVLEVLPSLEIMQKWWEFMNDIMETNADNSPVTTFLEEVFYLL